MSGGSGGQTTVRMALSGGRVRVMAKIMACVGKINDEFFIEPSADQCIFRVVSTSRTAHFATTFTSSFFSSLDYKTTGAEALHIRMSCKYFGAIFRHLSNINGMVIYISSDSDRLSVDISTSNEGVTKRYELNYSSELSDKAECSRMTMCVFRGRAALLSEALSGTFHNKVENIQFTPSQYRLNVKNYEDTAGSTTLSLSTSDLVEFKLAEPSRPCNKTFELRHLRTFLALCDSCNLDFTASFDAGDSPVLLEMESVDLTPENTPVFYGALLVAAWEPTEEGREAMEASGTPQQTHTPHTPVSIQAYDTPSQRARQQALPHPSPARSATTGTATNPPPSPHTPRSTQGSLVRSSHTAPPSPSPSAPPPPAVQIASTPHQPPVSVGQSTPAPRAAPSQPPFAVAPPPPPQLHEVGVGQGPMAMDNTSNNPPSQPAASLFVKPQPGMSQDHLVSPTVSALSNPGSVLVPGTQYSWLDPPLPDAKRIKLEEDAGLHQPAAGPPMAEADDHSWEPEKYLSQVQLSPYVSQHDTRPKYLLSGDYPVYEDFLEPSPSPPRFE